MKTIGVSGSFVLGMGLLTAPAAFADLIVGAPIDVVGNLPVATFVGDHFATQSYKDWGNEPFVAVNPININDIVISSFSFGAPRNPDAALFYSTNGGANWTLQFTRTAAFAQCCHPKRLDIFLRQCRHVAWRCAWRGQHLSRHDNRPELACRMELDGRRAADQYSRFQRTR